MYGVGLMPMAYNAISYEPALSTTGTYQCFASLDCSSYARRVPYWTEEFGKLIKDLGHRPSLTVDRKQTWRRRA